MVGKLAEAGYHHCALANRLYSSIKGYPLYLGLIF